MISPWDEDGWLKDMPFLIVACMVHAALFSMGPLGSWTKSLKAGTQSVVVDFVEELPKAAPIPEPELAPVPEAPKKASNALPGGGDGAKVKPRPVPIAKVRKIAKKPVVTAAQRQAAAERHAQARRKAAIIAEARREAAELRQAQIREARQAAAERAASLAEARAEAARQAAAARAEAARQAAAERAAVKAAERRRQIEISGTLAAMKEPDEALADAVTDSGARAGAAKAAAGMSDTISAGPSAGPALETSQPDSSDAVYDDQGGPRGGVKGDGAAGNGGVGWALEGPAGNRRLLARRLPSCPAWVGQRALSLSAQIKFQVARDGSVKSGAVIKRTSGFPEIDRLALNSLKGWKFESANGEPWGLVTFRFLPE